MCSKIENTVRELTKPTHAIHKYVLTVMQKYKKGNLVIAYKAFFPLLRCLLLHFVLNEQVCFGGLLVPTKQMFSSPPPFFPFGSRFTANYKEWISDPRLFLERPGRYTFFLSLGSLLFKDSLKNLLFY